MCVRVCTRRSVHGRARLRVRVFFTHTCTHTYLGTVFMTPALVPCHKALVPGGSVYVCVQARARAWVWICERVRVGGQM